MTRLDWDAVNAAKRRRRRNPLAPQNDRYKLSTAFGGHAITCDKCGRMIRIGQWARTTVVGRIVHGYGCPGVTAAPPKAEMVPCATCGVSMARLHSTTNRLGQTVHAHGCPRKNKQQKARPQRE